MANYRACVTAHPLTNLTEDVLTIVGNQAATVRVRRIRFSGTANFVGAYSFTLVKRSSLNSGGNPISVPCVSANLGDPDATAQVFAYRENPTPGGRVGIIDTIRGTVTTEGGGLVGAVYEFMWMHQTVFDPVLGPDDSLSLNLNGVGIPGGLLDIAVEFSE